MARRHEEWVVSILGEPSVERHSPELLQNPTLLQRNPICMPRVNDARSTRSGFFHPPLSAGRCVIRAEGESHSRDPSDPDVRPRRIRLRLSPPGLFLLPSLPCMTGRQRRSTP